ncbi:MAG: glutathione S-transferase [Bradymonadia bacterium]
MDDRVKPATWGERKASIAFGKLPAFTVNGTEVSESNPILSLIGRKYDLHPNDVIEAARHEGLMDAMEDVRAHLFPTVKVGVDEEEGRRAKYIEGPLQTSLAALKAPVNGTYVGGDTLAVAHLKLFVFLKFFRAGVYDHMPKTVLDKYPKLVAHFAAVSAHTAVTSWYAK